MNLKSRFLNNEENPLSSPCGEGLEAKWFEIFQKIGDADPFWSIHHLLGSTVALSTDGLNLAIGSAYTNGNGTSSRETANNYLYTGQVGMYDLRSGLQIGGFINGENQWDHSGYSISLSGDASSIAIGSPFNDGCGLNSSGHVRTYDISQSSGTIHQFGSDIDGENAWDESGRTIALSRDGSTLIVGAPLNEDNGENSGHVRIYKRSISEWVQVGESIVGKSSHDTFGHSVAISSDGTIVAVGATGGTTGGTKSGYVSVYRMDVSSNEWIQVGVDLKGDKKGDLFGYSLALSDDGKILACGATEEDNGGAYSPGYVRIFELDDSGNNFTKVGSDIRGEQDGDFLGASVDLSIDGSILACGAPYNNANRPNSGLVRVFHREYSNWVPIGGDILGDGGFFNVGFEKIGNSVALNGHGNIVAVGSVMNTDEFHARAFELRCTSTPTPSPGIIFYDNDYSEESSSSEFSSSGWNTTMFIVMFIVFGALVFIYLRQKEWKRRNNINESNDQEQKNNGMIGNTTSNASRPTYTSSSPGIERNEHLNNTSTSHTYSQSFADFHPSLGQ